MNLSGAIAAEIVHRARLVLNRDVMIADYSGRIIGSGQDGGRISDIQGTTSVDALRACQEGRVVRGTFNETPIAWCPFVYDQQTVGSFGVVEDEVQVTPEAVNLLQGLAEVIVHQHFLLEHVQPSEKMQATFLRQVLTSSLQESNEVYRQADILQLNLRAAQAVMLIDIANFELPPSEIVSPEDLEATNFNRALSVVDRIKSAFAHNSENVVCYFGRGRFVVIKNIGGDGLTTRNTLRFLQEKAAYLHKTLSEIYPQPAITLGVGQYYPELGGLRKSFQEARLALSVGTKVWGPGRVYHIKQVGMFVTLANVAQEHKAELAHQILFPLLRDTQLYKTVQMFLQSGLNLTEAAEKLHIHRNTLIYRLEKTKKLIGLDPRVFDDALQIKLGLMFYQEA
jgi:carbohydrate diacid regulator